MIDSPKVESTGTSNPPRALRSSTSRCSAQPITAISGITTAKAEKRLHPEAIGQNVERVSREHRKAAVREVDDAHDAEHERQAAGDQRVIAAEQNALNDLVDENQGCGASARDDS